MEKHRFLLFSVLACILIVNTSLQCSAAEDQDRKDYIVYLGSLPARDYTPLSHHLGLLQEVINDRPAGNFLTRSYKRSFNGFAAKLTRQEADSLASCKEVVSVFPSTTLRLQTTQSWDFMGFSEALSKSPKHASDIIVGVIDSGIWPESESFSDEGFDPPTNKWKGACQGGKNFTCNKKLIGARYYSQPPYDLFDSARDGEGHGTHTASTVSGNIVKDVSFYGVKEGSARGGLPSSRIAAYKVCGSRGCPTTSVLAAFDDAIADGVDIITISIGGDYASLLEDDAIAIGAFHAMAKGILTVQSAGNFGPSLGSTISVAPWKLSVAASSINRRIITKISLGNGKTLAGGSINSFTLNGTKFPLIRSKNAGFGNCSQESARFCADGCLDSNLVKGKIVICEAPSGISEVKRSGAIGVVTPLASADVAYIVPLPAVDLYRQDFNGVQAYQDSSKSPEAEILRSETIMDAAAPVVASFSSRGPNTIVPGILKPDITAPGVDILAAFPSDVQPSKSPGDNRRVKYSIMSGTSMSCPHVAGVAAYVKATHPDWSPSAIKSAIMTTAWTMTVAKNPEGEFAYGSGHVDPVKAINPGLVYDASEDDYKNFLCSQGYDTEKVRKITGDNSSCSNGSTKTSPKDLNYPSMTANVSRTGPFEIVFHRTVTNVGIANSTYKVKIFSASRLKITVVPGILSFKSLKEQKSFNVTVAGRGLSSGLMESASLVWDDGQHVVRSPIVVFSIMESMV